MLKTYMKEKKFGLAYTVVMKLLNMRNCLRKGYHIFMDNFFTSIPLAKELYKLQTFVTGTVRRNRKYLPAAFGNKFQIGQKQYFRRGPILTEHTVKKNLNVPQFCSSPPMVKLLKQSTPEFVMVIEKL